uniref:Galectin n=1 Tax=Panagrellus redivivus TaxID=6233 RepID=A0A7E4V7T2_PANRE
MSNTIFNKYVSFKPNESLSVTGSVTPTEEYFGRIEFHTDNDEVFLIHIATTGIEFITDPGPRLEFPCPFEFGSEFEMVIKMAFHGFEIWIDGKYFASNNYTFSPLLIDKIHVSAFDEVKCIKLLRAHKSPTGGLEQFGPDGSWWASMYDKDENTTSTSTNTEAETEADDENLDDDGETECFKTEDIHDE